MSKKIIIVDFDDTLFFTQRCRDAACMEVLGRVLSKEELRGLKPKYLKRKIYALSCSKYARLSKPNRRLIGILSKAKGIDIVVLTARITSAKKYTIGLLRKYRVPYKKLILRPNHLVGSKDEIWKLGRINGFVGKYEEIDFYEDKIGNISHFKGGLKHSRKSKFILVERDGSHRVIV